MILLGFTNDNFPIFKKHNFNPCRTANKKVQAW